MDKLQEYYNTFAGWKSLGFYVKKGEKSTIRNNNGECLFSYDQVYELYDASKDELALEFVDQSDLY